MADWRDIPNESIEPDAPVRSIDGFALRDNPIAIAEGAPGAPRVQSDGIGENAVFEAIARDVVLGGLGGYAVLRHVTETESISPGDNVAGANLEYAAGLDTLRFFDDGNALTEVDARAGPAPAEAQSPSGTWMCMGHISRNASGADTMTVRPSTLFVRVA